MGLCGRKQGTVFHHVIFVGTHGGEARSAGEELSSFEGLRPLPRISKWQVEVYLCSHTEREGLVLETCPVLSDLVRGAGLEERQASPPRHREAGSSWEGLAVPFLVV